MFILFVATRNEAELLRLNLAHHLGWGFDHVAVADNESTDSTQDVLREFGDAVSATSIRNPNERFSALTTLLGDIEERHGLGLADWVAVSDTDEFWWTPDTDLRGLLAGVPEDAVAVNSDQKLFLPTELDPAGGPVYCRRTFRTSSAASPLHTSYRRGKSLYRAAWVRNHGISDAHWCAPLPLRRFKRPLVHHYMIDDEESFVNKVKSLERWGAQLPPPVQFRDYKMSWWRLYERAGETGLREYYRRQYMISADALPAHLERGELIKDTQFADFKLGQGPSHASPR
jgi:hypothetical protein